MNRRFLEDLKAQFAKFAKGQRRFWCLPPRRVHPGVFWSILALDLIVLCFFLYPAVNRNKSNQDIRIYSREGILLRQSLSNPTQAYQEWVPLKSVPESFIQTILTAEDSRFYFHFGFDPIAILRSGILNVQSLRVVSGASTITQQLARTTNPMPKNRVLRKIAEIIYAIRLETQYSKDQILEMYLNKVPLKYNRVGIQAASQVIFKKDVSLLSREEGILLASLIRRSSMGRGDLMRSYQDLALRISKDASTKIQITPPSDLLDKVYSGPGESPSSSSTTHLESYLIEELKRDTNGADEIYTTIEFALNEKVQRIVRSELRVISKKGEEQAGVVVLRKSETKDLFDVIALVGSSSFESTFGGQINSAFIRRMAGSTLKPLIYAYAMDRLDLTPDSEVEDQNLSFSSASGGIYQPKNNDMRYWGRLTLREALANSRNVPAVEMTDRLGVDSVYDFLSSAGIQMRLGPEEYGQGIALGTGGVTLIELARSYGGLANGGILLPLRLGRFHSTKRTARDMRKSDLSDHSELILGSKTPTRFTSERSAALITQILADKNARRKTFGKRNFLDFPYEVAAKTGTSKDYRDSWTVGYGGSYVVAVWVGKFSAEPMDRVSGSWGAGRIFHEVIRTLGDKIPPRFDHPVVVDRSPNLGEVSVNDLRILSPLNQEVYLIDPGMPLKSQAIPIRIANAQCNGRFMFQINSLDATPFSGCVETTIPATRGSHTLSVLENGVVIRKVSFEVK